MNNFLRIAIATVVALGVSAPASAEIVSFCAGQSIDVGEVRVTNDANNLYVTFDIFEPGWYLAETHVAVGDTSTDIPTNEKGNPVPGQFPYACVLDGSLQADCVVTIPRDGLDLDVEVAAHAAVFQLAGDGCGEDTQYASEVILNNQGTRLNGTPVLAARTDPESVFAPGGAFFSLGFGEIPAERIGGDLTVGFGYPVYNGPGIDVCVQEITNGRPTYPEEFVKIYDDADLLVATVSNRVNGTGYACVDLPGSVQTTDSVKLVDNTDPTPDGPDHIGTADAYDVDFVAACYLYLGEETAWGAACYEDEGTRFVEKGNWGTYFNYRMVPDNCVASVYNGHDYLTCQGQNTVPESEAFCAGEGMQLAYIDDLAENTAVVDNALAAFGYTDFESTSYWIANTKTDSPILPWAAGEPNSVADQCIHILRYGGQPYEPYGWNDAGCTNWTWGWVCESADD